MQQMSLWGIANDICSSAVIIHNIFSIVLPCWLIAVGAPAASRPLLPCPRPRWRTGHHPHHPPHPRPGGSGPPRKSHTMRVQTVESLN